MADHLPKINRFVYGICLGLAFLASKLLFRLKNVRDPRIAKVQGGLLIVANHQAYVDPILVATAFPRRRLHFVAGRYLFDNKLILRLFSWLGVIAKQQMRPDTQTIRDLLGLARKEATLFMFPEGQRSVDGRTNPVQPSTGRLIKKLGLSVAAVRLHGAYLSWPRWSASGIRWGQIRQETELLYTREDLQHASVAEVDARLKTALYVDDYADQAAAAKPARFRSKAPAAGVDRILHYCPVCDTAFALASDGQRLVCQSCAVSVTMEKTGLLRPTGPADEARFNDVTFPFSASPAVWHAHQVEKWRDRVSQSGFTFTASCHEILEGQTLAAPLPVSIQVLPKGYEISWDDRHQFIPYDGSVGLFGDFGIFFDLLNASPPLRLFPSNGQNVVACLDLILASWMSAKN